MSNVISISGGDIRQTARALVLDGLTQLADRKNVPLTPALCEVLADGVLQRMDITALCQLAARDERGLTVMVREADAELDATVLARMWSLVALFEGGKDINDPVVRATGGTILEKFTAGLPKQGFARWPDPMQLVADHYSNVPRGPIVGVAPDGTVLTRWWLGLTDLHRDPKEGPANIEQRDGRLIEEYWFKGQLHRPHEDGPAMIYTHYKDFDLSGEEYFENGKWHRPSHLGPAVTHRDRKGEVVMELYIEHGQLHRDPSAGPAWWHVRDARTERDAGRPCTEIKYYVRGQLHRDEKNGPALITRDNETGVLVAEEYRRDDHFFREKGPAVIERSPEGVLTFELYRGSDGFRGASEGPSVLLQAQILRETVCVVAQRCRPLHGTASVRLQRRRRGGPDNGRDSLTTACGQPSRGLPVVGTRVRQCLPDARRSAGGGAAQPAPQRLAQGHAPAMGHWSGVG
jgi:hypothetical protein